MNLLTCLLATPGLHRFWKSGLAGVTRLAELALEDSVREGLTISRLFSLLRQRVLHRAEVSLPDR